MQRVKADENAVGRLLRQNSQNTAGTTRLAKEYAVKTSVVRQALGEVTMAAVNRKVCCAVYPTFSPHNLTRLLPRTLD